MSIWAVVPAAGSGQRYSQSEDKLLATLQDRTVLELTVAALLRVKQIQGVMLVTSPERQSQYQSALENLSIAKPVLWTTGGSTRRESVCNGAMALPDETKWVVVHDAARPLIVADVVDNAISFAIEQQAAVAIGLPLYDTIKQVRNSESSLPPVVDATLDRQTLWRVQTPQIVPRQALLKAHNAVPLNEPVTDDIQLLELNGFKPLHIFPGHASNLKITVQDDISLAKWWLSQAENHSPALHCKHSR